MECRLWDRHHMLSATPSMSIGHIPSCVSQAPLADLRLEHAVAIGIALCGKRVRVPGAADWERNRAFQYPPVFECGLWGTRLFQAWIAVEVWCELQGRCPSVCGTVLCGGRDEFFWGCLIS